MTATTSTPLYVPAMELPASAPQVRITAGIGTASQKTWNLRRPLTLIGSKRPAHIVLHDRDISDAHCVIVNTGSDVILKDLQTKTGTIVSKERVNITVLQDGDVVVIGSNRIQVAIQVPRDAAGDSRAGLKYDDPTMMPSPVSIALVHTDQVWSVVDAVVLVGRHELAGIRLDHEQVTRRHAVLFRYGAGLAVFDLGGENGLLVNARITPQSPLFNGDRVTIGPFGLEVRAPRIQKYGGSADASGGHDGVLSKPVVPPPAVLSPVVLPPPPRLSIDAKIEDAAALDAGLESLQIEISDSWKRLNEWEAKLVRDASALNQQETDLSHREKELDARDASLRGQFHDISRLQEKLTQQEKEYVRQRQLLDADKRELELAKNAYLERDSDLTRRTQELTRREHAFAQRWTRLRSMKCQSCGEPVCSTDGDPLEG